MQTVTFKSVYRATLRAWSRDPDTANLTSAEQEVFADRITAAAKEGIEHAFWPDCMLIEQRMFRDAWSGSTTYALGAEIYYAGNYYTSLQATNLNKNPATETTWWELTTELDRYIPWAQTGKTAIGTAKAVSKRNPRVSRYPDYIPFTISENGIQVTDLAPAEVYLEYRRRPPTFTRAAYSASIAYVAGNRVYYDATGECYLCILAGTNKTPSTETTYWTKIDMPAFLELYIPIRVRVEALTDDGQEEMREKLQNEADLQLDKYMRAIFRQQGQYVTARVATYGS